MNPQVVIITGASGNVGMAAARAFQVRGDRTILVDRSVERLERAFARQTGSTDHHLLGGVDLGDEEAVYRVVDQAAVAFGRIDCVVHTVGGWRGGTPVHETPIADWTALFDVNVRTTLLLARAVSPHFLRQRSGRFITVGARSGLAGEARSAAYSAAKSAVLRLNESFSAEMKHHGVNVNCVLPSIIDTPQNRAAMPSADPAEWVGVDAIADVVLFLASDGARAIHGAAIPVYGLS